MRNVTLKIGIEHLKDRVVPLERFVHFFGTQFDPPYRFKSQNERGFRFANPNYRHFCLLRSCRIVSALNASIELARCGYVQEIGVILRSVIEYNTQVEYVLIHLDSQDVLTGKAAAFITNYFEDDRRTGEVGRKRVKLNQKEVHDAIGAELDKISALEMERKPASQLLSHVYFVFSNYVHGRYPECMDLFGGTPGRFHLDGMSGTPKDAENIEVIDTLITSTSNCFIQIAQALKMHALISSDQLLADWFKKGVSGV